MYQVQGQSWIVMGDPVGPGAEWGDLLWQIREMADAAQGRLLLYQISTDALPIAIDLGLQLVKYGEEARVALPDFTMEGPEKRSLRHSERRAAREGASFEIVPAAQVPALMAELKTVSDAWLRERGMARRPFRSAASIPPISPASIARWCASRDGSLPSPISGRQRTVRSFRST